MAYSIRLSEAFAERIKALWATGKSATEIAELEGTSRSAVLGKLHRMRAKGEVGFRRSADDVARRRIARKNGTAKYPARHQFNKLCRAIDGEPAATSAPRGRATQPPLAPPPFMPGMVSRKIHELNSKTCRFIADDPKSPSHRYCGHKVTEGAWCDYHHAIVFPVRRFA